MDLSKVEKIILGRFDERCYRAGGIKPGYGMRVRAIRFAEATHPELDFDSGLESLKEKGVLQANEEGTWMYLTEKGAEVLEATPLTAPRR